MKQKTVYVILVFIFLLTLGTRLFFAYGAESTSFDSYFHLRQIDHIAQTGLPDYNDGLSYGGRLVRFPPLFHYILAAPAVVFSLDHIARFLPNLFFALLVFVVYGLSYKISQNHQAALFSAFIVGFLPVSFSSEPLLGVAPVSLSLLLSFTALWALLKAKKWSVYVFMGLIFVLSLIDTSSGVVILGLGLFVVMSAVDRTALSREEFEALLFSFFLFLWIQFLFFKKAILLHGLGVFTRNVPLELVSSYYSGISIVSALFGLGLLPLLGGLYVIYKFVFKLRKRKMSLIISLIIAATMMLWLKLITPTTGFLFLGVAFTVIFSQLYTIFFSYLKRTKLSKLSGAIFVVVLALFVVNSVIPSLVTAKSAQQQVPAQHLLDAYEWLADEVQEDGAVLAPLGEGHVVSAVAGKKNVIDNNFLFSDDATQRLEDINAIYSESSIIEATRLLDKYGVQYIVFSELAQETYGIDELVFIADREVCFIPVYQNETIIYELRCHYQEVRREI